MALKALLLTLSPLAGPSGSGKTSLLSIIGARAQKMMQVQGTVNFNDRPLTKRLKRQVGYVMQVSGRQRWCARHLGGPRRQGLW